MSDSSKGSSNHSTTGGGQDGQGADSNASPERAKYNEQRVYIETNLETLVRIHTAIKRSGQKFRNQSADDALKRTEEKYQVQKIDLGDHQALQGENGEHERFRRYLTKIVLWNGYKHNLVQTIICKIDRLAEASNPQDKQDREFLLQKKLLIVIRAYLDDPARLTTIQRRLINASVVRRNRLIYAGSATKAPLKAEKEHQVQTTPINKPVFSADRAQLVSAGSQRPQQPITPAHPKQEIKASKSFVAQPATALESGFSITGALMPPRATKSAATKMSARVGQLDYPKCPAKDGQFSCPYCPIILTEEYTKKGKWRGHVTQDLCPYICIFDDCESPDEMFASTYDWMSHMARFHSKIEWVCHMCTKHCDPDVQDNSIIFQTPELLEQHLITSHPVLDMSEFGVLVDAGKRVAGIQKVRCPLCRPGLVTLERDEENDNITPPPSAGHEIGLIQLEDDEHIATHIHEFALHSFPSPEATMSEDAESLLSHSFISTRVEIMFEDSSGPDMSEGGHSQMHGLIETTIDNISSEITDLFRGRDSILQRFEDILRVLLDTVKMRLTDPEESVDIDNFASALNESLDTISQLRYVLAGSDPEEPLLNQLFDNLDRSNKVLQQDFLTKIRKHLKRIHCHIPYPQNPNFVDHITILNTLEKTFFGPTQGRLAALSGSSKTLPKENHSRHQLGFEPVIAYFAHGRTDKAIEILECVVAVALKTLEEGEPFRLTSRQTNKVIEILEHVVVVALKTLEEGNPFRLTSRQTNKVIEILEHVAAITSKTLEEGNPFRLTVEKELTNARLVIRQTTDDITVHDSEL
ncbi:hypothetical protein F5Y10DRAFT_291016 [Nemania abortiva]|nr:hypothetical protein F5Y10DRAFT_291016 [Nemania abortiva]